MLITPVTSTKYNAAKGQYSFTANKSLLLRRLEKRVLNISNRPEDISQMYTNGINFLKGNISKDEYLSKLNLNLNKIYKNIGSHKLTQKEEAFFDNMFTSMEIYNSPQKITEKQLKDALAILAEKD